MGLAARGSRQLGETIEKIEDVAELTQVRKQASKVRLKSSLVGVVMTLAAIFLL